MPKVSELRTNFTAGELSPLVDTRTQFNRYFNGSITLENWVVLTQGPIFRRKGFRFIAETKDSTKKSRLLPFEFSTAQTYAIELGEGYLRFFSAQGRVIDDSTAITGATNANPVVITDTAHPYSNGDVIIVQSVVGMTELNGLEFTIANKATNTYELLGVDGTSFGAYASGGTSSKIHEITNPYTEAELFDVKYVQDSDIMYFAHPNHPLQKLIRVSINVFTLADVDLLKGPYIEKNIVSTETLTLSGTGGASEGDTLTLTAIGHTPFTTDHIGGLWKITEGTDIAHLEVTGFTSSTVVTVITKSDVVAGLQGVAKFTWSEGEFSDARSFPGAISFHEQRLILAGSANAPQKIWFSKSNADYENFEVGTQADDPFNIKIAAQRGDPIRWLFSDTVLFVGTASGIFRIKSSSNSSSLKIDDIDVKRQISYGASNIQPELVGDSPVYMQKGDNKARGIAFSAASDKYGASNLTVDADQIIESGIVEIDYQQDPLSSLWAVRGDGQIARLTSEADQEVLAWSRFITQGLFESITIISSATDNDEIYTIVNRTIGGVTKRFVEVQEPNYEVSGLDRFYVDSGLTFDGTQSTNLTLSASTGSFVLLTEGDELIVTEDGFGLITEEVDVLITSDASVFSASDVGKEIHELRPGTGRALIVGFTSSTIVTVEILEPFSSINILTGEWAFAIENVTGLTHLIGKTVSINSDGATEPDQVVDSNGEVNISSAGAIIHVGLSYVSTQKNMPLEATALARAIGSSQHKDMRVNKVIITFQDTNGGEIISGNDKPLPITARSTNNNMNETPPLFDGDKDITTGGGWGRKGQVSVIQSGPQPMTIKSITYKVTVNDK